MGDPKHTSGGFGERTFRADGRRIFVEPKAVLKADGRTNVSLGFPFADLTDATDEETAAALATYLSDPARAAAPDLLNACEAARDWLQEWASAEPQLALLNAAISKAKGEAR